jgi:hypothetical protein
MIPATQTWLPTTAPAPGTSYPVLTPGQYPYLTLVNHGVIDAAAKVAYTSGQCHALALALNECTGWPIVAILAKSTESTQPLRLIHVVTAPRSDLWLDINGPSDPDELIERCTLRPGETSTYALINADQAQTLASPHNALGTIPACQPSPRAARSMVTPLLELYPELSVDLR